MVVGVGVGLLFPNDKAVYSSSLLRRLFRTNGSCSIESRRRLQKSCCCVLNYTAAAAGTAVLAAAVIFSSSVITSPETLFNVPQTLSGEEGGKQARIQRPRSRKAESCTIKCVTTCIRGGDGEGPFNVRRPLVVFKQGFRSRQYCLVECSEICNLIKDGEDGP